MNLRFLTAYIASYYSSLDTEFVALVVTPRKFTRIQISGEFNSDFGTIYRLLRSFP